MKNEPQLSSEMEKRKHFGGKDWKALPAEPKLSVELEERLLNECGLCDLQYPSDFEKVVHFLATALEEQRRSYIEQVEALPLIDSSGYSLLIDKDDVLALLNGTEDK